MNPRILPRFGPIVSLLVLTMLGSTLVGCSGSTKPKASSSKAAKPRPRWDAVLGHLDEQGRLDADGAKLAFSIAFTPLPGVTLPSGPRSATETGAGSFAVREILAHWADLSVAQRKVVLPFIDPGPTTLHGVAPSHRGVGTRLAAPAPAALRNALTEEVWRIAQEEAKKLGVNAGTKEFYELRTVSTEQLDPKTKEIAAAAWTFVVPEAYTLVDDTVLTAFSGPPRECLIFLPPSTWKELPTDGTLPTGVLTEQLAHEVFHCFQGSLIGSDDVTIGYNAPAWFVEGGAAWAGADFVGKNYYRSWWEDWLTQGSRPLFERAYDAIGFYSTLERLGALSWPRWREIFGALRAANKKIDSAVVYDDLTKSTPLLGQAWAPAYTRRASWSPDWEQAGLDVGPSEPIVIGAKASASPITVTAKPYTVALRSITAADEPALVTVTTGSGVARVHDTVTYDEVAAPVAVFCLGGSCRCAATSGGTGGGGIDAQGPVRLALSGMKTGGEVTITAEKIDTKHCDKGSEKPDGPGSGSPESCSGSCASSNGDPHFETVDSVRYDMQGVGEYVLLDAGKDFAVQTRQQSPANHRDISVNTAVAARIGSQRAVVSAPRSGGDPMTITVDGATVSSPVTLDDGGRIDGNPGGELTVTWPDESKVQLHTMGIYGLHVFVDLAKDHVESAKGLLAPTEGGRARARDGHVVKLGNVVDDPKSFDRVHFDLAESWRVTDKESLFDYGPGESTATFTDRSAPSRPLPVPQAARDRAAQACKGISDEGLRNECIFDASVLDDTSVATSYEALATKTTRPTTTTTRPKAGGPLTNTTLELGDSVPAGPVTTDITDTITIDAPTAFYVQATNDCVLGNTYTASWKVTAPDGTALNERKLCGDLGRLDALTAGSYTLSITLDGSPDSRTGFNLIAVRPDQTARLSIGDTVKGNIPGWGARNTYTFTGKAKQQVELDVTSCEKTPQLSWELSDDEQSLLGVGGFGCRAGGDPIELPADATYTIVVKAEAVGLFETDARLKDDQPFVTGYAFSLRAAGG